MDEEKKAKKKIFIDTRYESLNITEFRRKYFDSAWVHRFLYGIVP